MKSNYKEMKEFAMMGSNLGCDGIYFSKIFGLKDLKEIKENINIFPDPEVLLEIKNILKDPIFKFPQISIEGIKEYCYYSPRKFASEEFRIKLFLFGLIFNQSTSRIRTLLRPFKKLIQDFGN